MIVAGEELTTRGNPYWGSHPLSTTLRGLALWVHHIPLLFTPRIPMDRFFKIKIKNKRKKSPKNPQPGIPTEIAVGPSHHPQDSVIGPKGRQSLPSRNPEVDRPDLTMTLDDGDGGSSRITLNVGSEDQGLIAPKASTSGAAVYNTGTERGYVPMGECFWALRLGLIFMLVSVLTSLDVDAGNTGGREGEPAEASKGMCRYCFGIGSPLTHPSYEESSEGHQSRGRSNSL